MKKVKRVQVYLFLRNKRASAFIKDRDILCWYIPKYRQFKILKSRIPVSKIYILPSPRKIWNTEYRDDFDQNPEIPL